MARKAKTSAKLPDLETLVQQYNEWEESTRSARVERRRELAYYDSKQWTQTEIDILKAQNSPIVTVNRICRKVNYVLGTEIQTRIDPKALPRTPAHQNDVNCANDALRYLADKIRFDRIRSKAFKHLLMPGVCGALTEITTVDTKGTASTAQYGDDADPEAAAVDGKKFNIQLRYVSWDRCWWDPRSCEEDFSDAEYIGIITWMSIAKAKQHYRNSKEALRVIEDATSKNGSDLGETTDDKPQSIWIDRKGKRIKILEQYFELDGQHYVTHFTESGFLFKPTMTTLIDDDGNSVCPLQFGSGYIADSDNERYGMVRAFMSLQDEINHIRSATLREIKTERVMYEEGAIDDIFEFQTQQTMPAGAMKLNPDALAKGRVNIPPKDNRIAERMQMLQEAKGEIEQVGPSAMQDISPTMSGRLFLAKQKAASMELETLFDNLHDWDVRVFRSLWYAIRKYWTEEMWLRVTDDMQKLGYRFVTINKPMTRAERLQDLMQKGAAIEDAMEGVLPPVEAQEVLKRASMMAKQFEAQMQQQVAMQQQQAGQPGPPAQIPPEALQQVMTQAIMKDPTMQEMTKANDVAQLDVDIIIDVRPNVATIELEEFEMLSTLAGTMPGIIPPAVIIEASQLRNKEKLLEMLNRAPDPEAVAMQKQGQQIGLMQGQAEVKRTLADAANKEASAAQTQAETPAHVEKMQTEAMVHAANAGEKTGGMLGRGGGNGAPPPMGP